MRGGGALTLLVLNVDLTLVGGVGSIGVIVMLWVQVAELSRVDVTNGSLGDYWSLFDIYQF